MKVINSGDKAIKLLSNGKFIELKEKETVELDERTFKVLHNIFPALVAEEEKKEVVIEAKAQPIETKKKGTKNGTRKKSK